MTLVCHSPLVRAFAHVFGSSGPALAFLWFPLVLGCRLQVYRFAFIGWLVFTPCRFSTRGLGESFGYPPLGLGLRVDLGGGSFRFFSQYRLFPFRILTFTFVVVPGARRPSLSTLTLSLLPVVTRIARQPGSTFLGFLLPRPVLASFRIPTAFWRAPPCRILPICVFAIRTVFAVGICTSLHIIGTPS